MTTVFVASAITTTYPRKLQKPKTLNKQVRESANSYILDSGIGDDVSNQKVLDLSVEYEADYVIAKDYLHEIETTIDSTLEFINLYTAHETESIPMCPIQPPHKEHYQQLPERVTDFFDHYVLGGMAGDDFTTREKINFIEGFDRVTPNVYIHGLGVGGGIKFVSKMAGRNILDSVDCATPELAGSFGAVLDERLRQTQVREMSGEGAAKRNRPLMEFNSWQVQDVWNREAKQQNGLAQY